MKRLLYLLMLIPFLGLAQDIEIRYLVSSSNTGNHISCYLPKREKIKNVTSLSKYFSKRTLASPGDTVYVISKSDEITSSTKVRIYAKGILIAQSEGRGKKSVIAKIVVPELEDINDSFQPKIVTDEDLVNELEETNIEANIPISDTSKVDTAALTYKKKSLRKSTILGGGFYTSSNTKLEDNLGFSVEGFLRNWYFGFNMHSPTSAEDSSNYIPGRSQFSHDSEMQFNLGYLFHLTHNKKVKLFLVPHLYYRYTTELWKDSFKAGTFYRRNPQSILSSGTKFGVNVNRYIIMIDIGISVRYDTFTDDVNFVFGDRFGVTLGYELFSK